MLYLDSPCFKDLEWWLQAVKNWIGAPLIKKEIEVQLEMDASGTKWGGTTMQKDSAGFWTKDIFFQPSNYRELLAVLRSLMSFKSTLKGKVVQILSNNITTVAYMNHLGGSNPVMSRLMTAIFTEAQEAGITLTVKYLAGKLNCRVDLLSRIESPYEWMLHPQLFSRLEECGDHIQWTDLRRRPIPKYQGTTPCIMTQQQKGWMQWPRLGQKRTIT